MNEEPKGRGRGGGGVGGVGRVRGGAVLIWLSPRNVQGTTMQGTVALCSLTDGSMSGREQNWGSLGRASPVAKERGEGQGGVRGGPLDVGGAGHWRWQSGRLKGDAMHP